MRKRQIALAALVERVREKGVRLGGTLAVVRRQERFRRSLEDLREAFVRDERESLAELEEQAPAVGGRPELQRLVVVARGFGVCVEREGAIARVAQHETRRLFELSGRTPRRAGELERTRVVMREELGLVSRPADGVEPLGSPPVLVRADGPRHLSVGDVSHEQVVEEYSTSPVTAERRSRRTNSFRSRRCRRSSAVQRPICARSAAAPNQKTRPTTAAS